MDAPLAAVRAGLDTLLPRGDLFLDAIAGWSSDTSAVVRGEAGAALGQYAAAFLYGEWRPRETQVGVGVRLTK